MNSDDAILQTIEAGVHLLLVTNPHSQEGFSVVPNRRIEDLAHAIRNLRTEFGYDGSNDESSK